MKRITFGVLAHVDSGKTTLSEAMLYNAGKTRKLGRVDHKDSFLDNNSIERDRGITIFSKQAVLESESGIYTLLDTPGHVDFGAETERTLQVLDYAILVISAPEGVQSHTVTLWKLLESYKVPAFIFVNKTDISFRENAEIIDEIKTKLSQSCMDFSKTGQNDFDEELAMCSEELMDSFLAGGIKDDDLRAAIQQRYVFPCYFGSALKNEGVAEFMNEFTKYTIQKSHNEAFGAKVYKISEDERGTRLTHIKITGGSLKVKTVLNIDGTEEKVNEIRIYSGSKYTLVPEAHCGTVCAVTGLETPLPGMGLGMEPDSESLILEPVFSYMVTLPEGVNSSDGYNAFKKLSQEETKLNVGWNEQLGKITVHLMGE
ncbi:MAG: GTP-binding protein, partial [Clostridia bacterium]|nr:GTP-binding protein [Clostridia bacterium]